MPAKQNRKIPLKAVPHSFCTVSHWVIGPNINPPFGVFFVIYARQIAPITSSVYNFIIGRIHCYMSRFSSCCGLPMFIINIAAATSVLNSDCRIVLLSRINTIGKGIIGGHSIKLGGRLIPISTPICSPIITHLSPTVICYDHALIVLWRYPKIMVIAMRGPKAFEGFPPIR